MTGRITPLERCDIDAAVVDRIEASFPRAAKFFADDGPSLPPVLGLLARHRSIAGPWLGFSGALLDAGVLEERTRELLILATAHRTGNDYIWHEHLPLAAAAGLSPVEVDAIAAPAGHEWSGADAPLLAAVEELVDRHHVTDSTWDALRARYDDEALLEVLFVVGAYSCLAMVLNGTELADREERR